MPKACQKLIVRAPNTDGPSQFHKLITTKPKTTTAMIPITPIFNPLNTHRPFMF